MFQKCPICNGTGTLMNSFGQVLKCEVCNGTKIIDEMTGRPPAFSTEPSEEEKRASALRGLEMAVNKGANMFDAAIRSVRKDNPRLATNNGR